MRLCRTRILCGEMESVMGEYKIGRETYMKEYRKNNRERLSALNRKWRENNRESARMHVRTHRYGISRDEYRRLIAITHCEICGSLPCSGDTKLSMDHNHGTNEIRGMLCRKCNSALGLACDSPEILRKMAQYLEDRCQPS